MKSIQQEHRRAARGANRFERFPFKRCAAFFSAICFRCDTLLGWQENFSRSR
jgi:hypothetical protein